jgi:hypothetical protein
MSERRPKAELYGFTLQEPIPSFPLLLKLSSEVVMVALQAIVQGVGSVLDLWKLIKSIIRTQSD